MNNTVKELLKGYSGDYIFPFFWQHGEDEDTLRKMMKVIHESGCGSVCIESRPHPDFCGPKWWTDMDVILDEARTRGMKVWILDDSHFPTGFANGALKNAPLELHRQSIASSHKTYKGKEQEIVLNLTKMFPPKISFKNFAAVSATKFMSKGAPTFPDDRILSVTAVDAAGNLTDIPVGNTGTVRWKKPAGTYDIYVTGLSRNLGIHREYINMMSMESCRILIDTVYEPHFEHYKDDFGKTIQGFFSDEPELGNGMYMTGANGMGTETDFPFSDELEAELEQRLGPDWKNKMVYLWKNGLPEKAAPVRFAFMDAVTKLVRKDFSEQIGTWCRDHGVRYIGHLIEDNNSHTKTGMSLGHYFRGLNGQDMSGIDDIGGQVYPQGEDLKMKSFFGERDGEFFHFALGNLAASAAAIEPAKHGDSMCEIFGNYGWSEGVRLEKYLAEHFMVRGVNHFVPHAFTGKAFPDPDCPPHFYAQGNNPQYRHFGSIVRYMNRVCTLISGGHRDSRVAVLYNAEFEWMGGGMQVQKPLRKLYEAQIQADTIPMDAFTETERYQTEFLEDELKVNGQEYRVLVVPYTQFLRRDMADVLAKVRIPILFTDVKPSVLGGVRVVNGRAVPLASLAFEVRKLISDLPRIEPASKHVRILEYTKENKLYYLFNEDSKAYHGTLGLDPDAEYYEYDAWNNKIYRFEGNSIILEPNKGMIILKDTPDEELLSGRIELKGEKRTLSNFRRSVCTALNYPDFGAAESAVLPDNYGMTDKTFSGFIRYEKALEVGGPVKAVLEITDAYEGVEVFVNGESLGIQVVPSFVYDLTDHLVPGKNTLTIEVATTLERQMSKDKTSFFRDLVLGMRKKEMAPTGITGEVHLYLERIA